MSLGEPKSLVIGASGQVGHKLLQVLGPENVLKTSRTPQPEWIHLDLAELADDPTPAEKVLNENEIGAVYCVGGATDVERCETEEGWADRTNHRGPAALAALCTHIPFVYFSTEYVFDGVDGPYTESAPVHPICEYGRSKASGEQAISDAHPSALILRTTVVYGDDPGCKNFLYSLRRILSGGNQMRVPADQISTPTYNWDLAQASVQLVRERHSGVFHVCGPDVISRYDFAVKSAELMGLDPSLIVPLPTSALNQKAPRPLNAGLLSYKLEQTLPDHRMRPLEQGVRSWLSNDR